MTSSFNFPNGIDNFEPVLINDLTVVNATHVQDLRISVLEIEKALVGVSNIPYAGTSIVTPTDNIIQAIAKLDANISAILVEIGFLGDGYEGYASRIDEIQNQLIAHRDSTGPLDIEGYGVHGVDGFVVGTNNVQTLLNKKLDTGTSSPGPKVIIRASTGDPGLRQFVVYNASGEPSAWIDEAGSAYFAGNVTILGDEIVEDIQVIQSHLIVDGYTILGDSSRPEATTTINGNLTVNNNSTTLNSHTFSLNGTNATMGNNSGILDLNYSEATLSGDLTVDGTLSVAGLTTLGDGSGDPLTITGDVTVYGDLDIQQAARLNGNVQLGNNTLTDNLIINVATISATVGSGEVNLDANINLTGNVIAEGTYHSLGASATASTNTIELNGNLVVAGASQLEDDVNILGNLSASGFISANGSLTALGSTTLGSGSTTLQANMATSNFTGSGSFGSSLSAGGSTSLGSLSSHTHTLTGNVNIAGNTTLSGNVSIGGGFQDNIYNGSVADHGGVTIYANGDVALDGKLTVKGPIDPISLVIVADASQETVPLKIFSSSGTFPNSPSYRIDLSGNTYSEGFLRYNAGGYLGPNGEFLKALATEFTIGKASQRPAANMYVTSMTVDNAGLLDIKGNTKLGTNASNTHLITGDTSLTGALTVSGNINGVSITALNQDFLDHLLGTPYPSHEATQIRFINNNTNIGDRSVRDALEVIAGSGWDSTSHDSLLEHLVSTTAHQSQNITFASSSFPSVTNVREAIHALAGSGWQLGVDNTLKQHLDSPIAHDAVEIVYAPVTNSTLTSTSVQGALQQASSFLDQFLVVEYESSFRSNLAPSAQTPASKNIKVRAAPRGVFVHAQTRTVVATDQTVSFATAPASGWTSSTRYRRASVALKVNGSFAVYYGPFASSLAALTDPFWEAGTLPIAIVNLYFNSNIAGDIANISAADVIDVRTLPAGTTGGPIVGTSFDVPAPQTLTIGTNVGGNTIFLGGATSTTVIAGALEIQGTTGGILFQATIGYDSDTLGGTLGIGESAGLINLGRADTTTHATGNVDVDKIITALQAVKTNNLDVLAYGNNLYIGSSVGTGTVAIGDSATTLYLAGSARINGTVLLTGSTATIDVDFPKSMAIGASVGSNTLTLGSASTQIIFLGSPRLKQSLKFEDPGVGTNTVTISAPSLLPSNTNVLLPTTSGTIALTNDVPVVFKDVLQEPTGFTNRDDSQLLFDPITRIFTIQPKAPAVEFIYWIRGAEYKKTAPQNVEIPDVDGLYLIYFDGDNLVADLVPPDMNLFSGVAFTAIVCWNSAQGKAIIFGDERHGLIMDGKTHEYLHETEGTRYQDGLQITNFSVGGSSALDSSAQFGITGGRIKDEDLTHNIVHNSAPSAPYEQNIAVIARLPVLYRIGSSGSWYRDPAIAYPIKLSPSTIQYNYNPGATWTTSPAPENSFVAMWILATNDMTEPVVAIMGQRTDSTLALARENNIWSNMNTGQFPTPESRLLYRVIFQTSSSYANVPNAVITDVADFRTVHVSSAGLTASSDHSALSGLEKDTHDQYVNKNGRAGGQIVYGGINANNTLTLRSTSNATKGQVAIDETTTSTSTTTGALTVAGGVGVQGNTFIGGYTVTPQIYGGTNASNTLILRSTTNSTKGQILVDETTTSTSPSTGAFVVSGGVGIGGNLSAGGAQYVNYGTTITSNYAVGSSDFIVPVNTSSAISNVVVTLPTISAATRGRLIIVKDVGGATAQLNKAIVIQASGGNTIDGAASVIIDTEYFALALVSNGTSNWSIV